VVAAGSVTPAGLYETLSGPGEQPEPLPPWLLLHIRPPPSPVSHAPEPREVPALRRLHGVLDAVASSGAGTRNGRLHWAACRAAEMITEGKMTREVAERVLLDAALESGLRGGESEARRTIASGLRSGGLR
jgi:hypothetical protein